MPRYPEPIEAIRSVDPVQSARGGRITRVTVRLDNGRAVSFYEVAKSGRVTVCETRADALEVTRKA